MSLQRVGIDHFYIEKFCLSFLFKVFLWISGKREFPEMCVFMNFLCNIYFSAT